MRHFEFIIHLDREPTDDEIDALYEAGFDDSSVECGNGAGKILVDRDAAALGDAVRSAVEQANAAGFEVVAIEDEDLVGRATIATRLGVSPQYVHLLATGKRGPGGFPVVQSGDGWALYSWTQVAQWARDRLGHNVPEDDDTRILAMADHLLRARALAHDTDRELFKALVPA